jgi:hypothetical protein
VSPAGIAALGAVGGALVTAAASVLVFLVRHRTELRNEHLRRAFEKHLERYEAVFVSARTAQDALRNYRTVSDRVEDRSDPFLHQLLVIATDAAHAYAAAVTWTHNPGMLYLELKLEEKCLQARDLMSSWLAVRRVHSGDVASIVVLGQEEPVPVRLASVLTLKPGDYRELRLETRRLVLRRRDDAKRLAEIDRALSTVIVELKAVMAY